MIMQARNMYVEEGLKSVRMDDIARAAVISKRTLYEAFGSKDELIFLAMRLHFDIASKELNREAAKAPNILIAILLVIKEIVRRSEVDWKLHTALERFFPKIATRISEVDEDERREEFRRGLLQGVTEGLIVPRANLDMAMVMLHHLSKSVVTGANNLKLPQGVTSQDAFVEVIVNVLRGISTTRGIELIDSYLEEQERSK